jgi:hypothetical protein
LVIIISAKSSTSEINPNRFLVLGRTALVLPFAQFCQRITTKIMNMMRVGISEPFNSPSGETPC